MFTRPHGCLFDPRGGQRLAGCQTLEGSFSAVSKPIFATKYSFCSYFRDLQDLQTFAPLQIQKFRYFANFCNFLQFCRYFCKMLLNYSKICHFSFGFSRKFAGISQNFSNFDEFHFAISKFLKKCQNPGKMQKIFAYFWLAGCLPNYPPSPSSHREIIKQPRQS